MRGTHMVEAHMVTWSSALLLDDDGLLRRAARATRAHALRQVWCYAVLCLACVVACCAATMAAVRPARAAG